MNQEFLGLFPIFEQYIPLESAISNEIEVELGGHLPEELLALTSNFGCAGFERSVSIVGQAGALPVAYIFGGGESSYSIRQVLDDVSEDLDAGMIPFAGDEFGNLFCLSINPAKPGVYWWGKETTDLQKCASSLDEFLGSLRAKE